MTFSLNLLDTTDGSSSNLRFALKHPKDNYLNKYDCGNI